VRLVVFGWGNEARGDDGLGPLMLARIAAAGWSGVTTVEDYQLQIEHALDIEGADCALFVDAGRDTPAPFSFHAVAPRRDMTHTTHALAPEAVLDVYAQVKGRAPPPAFALCLRGERFELGEGLSREGAQRLEAAWAFVQGLMAERSIEAWERAAFLPPSPTAFTRLDDSAETRPAPHPASPREDAGRGEERRRAPLSPQSGERQGEGPG
jgi:hydrogenase maturation protease